jgi:NADH:ubiquinone oxidoreductase subunit E
LKSAGKHTCATCNGTGCYIKDSDKLVAEAEKHLHIKPGETTPTATSADNGAMHMLRQGGHHGF